MGALSLSARKNTHPTLMNVVRYFVAYQNRGITLFAAPHIAMARLDRYLYRGPHGAWDWNTFPVNAQGLSIYRSSQLCMSHKSWCLRISPTVSLRIVQCTFYAECPSLFLLIGRIYLALKWQQSPLSSEGPLLLSLKVSFAFAFSSLDCLTTFPLAF